MSIKRNKIGEKYHRLLVIDEAPFKREPSGRLTPRVVVRCECGIEKETDYKQLKRGGIKSCGCLNEEIKTKVSEGDVFNLWTVIKETEGYFDKKGEKVGRTFLCKCVCGKEKNVHLHSLKKGDSKSCGCQGIIREEKIKKEKIIPQDTEDEQWKELVSYQGYYISTLGRLFNFKFQYMFPKKKSYSVTIDWKEYGFQARNELYKTFIGDFDNKTHTVFGEKLENIELKETGTKRVRNLRNVYSSMKVRCYNENNPDYKNYGARGIYIEESFNTVDKFIKWSLENGYEPDSGLSIDRVDNDGNYSENNCQWVTVKENCKKNRGNKLSYEIAFEIREGKYKELSNKEISEIFNCGVETISSVREFKTWIPLI